VLNSAHISLILVPIHCLLYLMLCFFLKAFKEIAQKEEHIKNKEKKKKRNNRELSISFIT